MNYLVKFLLILVILTTLGNLVSQVILWAPPVSDNDSAIGGGEKKPEISVNISTAVTPDASGKVPTGGVNIAGNTASVVVPEGVQMTEGATELTLTVQEIEESQAQVELSKNEVSISLDVHMAGVAADNEVPMEIVIHRAVQKGLNAGNIKLYHVENSETIQMTHIDSNEAFTAHNQFKYNPLNGSITLYMASFSEVAVVSDTTNPWDGTAATGFASGDGSESNPYVISNAGQLAYFGQQVDSGNEFIGQYIELSGDINLYGTDDSGNRYSFDPIGFKWYSAKDDNGDRISKNFQGTFDGQNHTIKNLYQNGWAMGLSYSNAGGGLFAGIYNATIQNLTMQGADIVMEAVPMGTVAAYAYGNCTFDNIRITSSILQNYNWDIAAIVGGVNGTHTFSNIHIDNTVTLSSLWGSFGGGIGGVIGSVYGGNNNKNSVTMKNVDVACVLDVYNDVTSAYQWYAYRFCGMLIGNTNEPGADGKNAYIAQASFLECDNVTVYYGDWVNYHYCKFTNQSNESGSVNWQNNYPWVRVEAGLSNPGYSNARYGHPIVDGVAVTAENHVHRENDGDCNLLIEFNQLYGGDQGVYGKPEHDGVTVQNYDYTITYREGDTVIHTEYIKDNSKEILAKDFYKMPGLTSNQYQWVNAGSSPVSSIPANNTNDITLYLDRADTYIARFLYQDGTLYKAIQFNNLTGELSEKEPAVPAVDGLDVVGWEEGYADKLKGATGDISIRPVYKINDYVQLNPVDENNDGVTDYYEVVGSNIPANNTDIVIPEEVNGIEIQYINTGAFANGGLRDVFVPSTVTNIGQNAFCANNDGFFGIGGEYPQIQIIYEGTKDDWNAITKATNWDDNIGQNSIVICRVNGVISGYYKKNSSYRTGWTWNDGIPDGFPRAEWDENGFPSN